MLVKLSIKRKRDFISDIGGYLFNCLHLALIICKKTILSAFCGLNDQPIDHSLRNRISVYIIKFTYTFPKCKTLKNLIGCLEVRCRKSYLNVGNSCHGLDFSFLDRFSKITQLSPHIRDGCKEKTIDNRSNSSCLREKVAEKVSSLSYDWRMRSSVIYYYKETVGNIHT